MFHGNDFVVSFFAVGEAKVFAFVRGFFVVVAKDEANMFVFG